MARHSGGLLTYAHKFSFILQNYFGDFEFVWRRYKLPVGILYASTFILFLGDALFDWNTFGLSLHLVPVIAIFFIWGCIFADLKETPLPTALEMLLVFVFGYLLSYPLSSCAYNFRYGEVGFQFSTFSQETILLILLPLPLGYAIRKWLLLAFSNRKEAAEAKLV